MAAPKKWSNLEGVLPALPDDPSGSEWLQKVFKAKDERQGQTMSDLAAEYNELEKEEMAADEAAAVRNIKYAAIERLMLEKLKASGSDIWRGQGHTISPGWALRPNVKDREALKAWVTATGRSDLLAVMPGTVLSLAGSALDTEQTKTLSFEERAAIKPGEPGSGVPPPGVEVFLQKKINRRKS